MATTTSYKSGNDSKSNDKTVWPIGWQPVSGAALKQAMLHVKNSFIEKAKQVLGHTYPGYEPTEYGITSMTGDYENFIGLVKLSKPDMLGGYYASIRVSVNITLSPPGPSEIPYELNGFLIDSKSFLNFVNYGQYGDMFIHDKEWQLVNKGDTLNLLKESMEQVKQSFIEKAKKDFSLSFDKYNPTIQGLYYFLIDEQYMIGLVQLGPKDSIGGMYASIRASQSTIIPIEPSWFLQGFLIDSRPFLHFVNSGQYGVVIRENVLPGLGTLNNNNNDNEKESKNNNKLAIKKDNIIFNKITWASTDFVQILVDKVKDSIKKQCGINYELSEYQVVSAASQNTGIFIGGVPMMIYYGRIYIGTNPWTQFESFINVSVRYSVFGKEESITVISANTFPL